MGFLEAVAEGVSSLLLTLLLGGMVVYLLSVLSSFSSSDMKLVRSSDIKEEGEEGEEEGDKEDDEAEALLEGDWEEIAREDIAEDDIANEVIAEEDIVAEFLAEELASAAAKELERPSASNTPSGDASLVPTLSVQRQAASERVQAEVSPPTPLLQEQAVALPSPLVEDAGAESGSSEQTVGSMAAEAVDSQATATGVAGTEASAGRGPTAGMVQTEAEAGTGEVLEEEAEAPKGEEKSREVPGATEEETEPTPRKEDGEEKGPESVKGRQSVEKGGESVEKGGEDEDEEEDWEGLEAASELEEQFNAAAALIVAMVAPVSSSGESSSQQPMGEGMQLLLYSLYKQATEGPCQGARPAFFSFKARAKWDAWRQLGSMSTEEAMEKYVELVSSIHPGLNAQGREGHEEDHGGAEEGTEGGGGGRGAGRSVSTFQHDEGGEAEDGPQGEIQKLVMEGSLGELASRLATVAKDVVDRTDEEGRTALHWAADRGLLDAIRLLVEHGADINVQDKEGQTALHYAAICEHEIVAKALIELGASKLIADNDYKTPIDLFPAEWN